MGAERLRHGPRRLQVLVPCSRWRRRWADLQAVQVMQEHR